MKIDYDIIGRLSDNMVDNLFENLVDLNSKETPREVLEKIIEIKKELGSFPLGSVKLSENEWAIVDSSGYIYFKIRK